MSQIEQVESEFEVDFGLKEEAKPPPQFNVVMRDLAGLGSDCSVSILMDVFGRNAMDAKLLTDQAALNGRVVVGTYPKDIAKARAHEGRTGIREHTEHDPFIQLMRFRCERNG